MNAVKSQEWRREKEERKLAKGKLEGWNDPDVSWVVCPPLGALLNGAGY